MPVILFLDSCFEFHLSLTCRQAKVFSLFLPKFLHRISNEQNLCPCIVPCQSEFLRKDARSQFRFACKWKLCRLLLCGRHTSILNQDQSMRKNDLPRKVLRNRPVKRRSHFASRQIWVYSPYTF